LITSNPKIIVVLDYAGSYREKRAASKSVLEYQKCKLY